MKCFRCHKVITITENRADHYIYVVIPSVKEMYRLDTVNGYQGLFDNRQGVCPACCERITADLHAEYLTPLFERFFTLVNRSQIESPAFQAAIIECFSRQHRYLQNEVLIALSSLLAVLGERSGHPMHTDGRNEWGYAWARRAADQIRC